MVAEHKNEIFTKMYLNDDWLSANLKNLYLGR